MCSVSQRTRQVPPGKPVRRRGQAEGVGPPPCVAGGLPGPLVLWWQKWLRHVASASWPVLTSTDSGGGQAWPAEGSSFSPSGRESGR